MVASTIHEGDFQVNSIMYVDRPHGNHGKANQVNEGMKWDAENKDLVCNPLCLQKMRRRFNILFLMLFS